MSQKGALCSLLSFACQFLHKGCMQYPGKQCYGGIVKYFVAVSTLHAQKTQWLRTGMWHAKMMWETCSRTRGSLQSSRRGGDLGTRRVVSERGRQKRKLWESTMLWLRLSHTFYLNWDTTRWSAVDWILREVGHIVRNNSSVITSREFLDSQPRSSWFLGKKRRGLLMKFRPTPFSEQICQ